MGPEDPNIFAATQPMGPLFSPQITCRLDTPPQVFKGVVISPISPPSLVASFWSMYFQDTTPHLSLGRIFCTWAHRACFFRYFLLNSLVYDYSLACLYLAIFVWLSAMLSARSTAYFLESQRSRPLMICHWVSWYFCILSTPPPPWYPLVPEAVISLFWLYVPFGAYPLHLPSFFSIWEVRVP